MLGGYRRDLEENQECVGGHGRKKWPQGGVPKRVAVQSLGGPPGPSGLDPISATLGELSNICNPLFPLLPLCKLGKLNNRLYLQGVCIKGVKFLRCLVQFEAE